MYEIERKFLITKPLQEILDAHAGMPIQRIEQQYLRHTGLWAIRIRKTVTPFASNYFLTMKRSLTEFDENFSQDNGMTCIEHEFEIDIVRYTEMARSAGPILHKNRYSVYYDGHIWEIDLFLDEALDGLIVAEIELPNAQENIKLPEWVGREVTNDLEYKNFKLIEKISA